MTLDAREDDAAGAYGFGLAVVEVFEVAGLDEEHFCVGMFVRWMRHLTGGKHGLVDFEIFAGLHDSGHDLARLAAIGVFVDRKLVVGDDVRASEVGIAGVGHAFGICVGEFAAHRREGR